MTVSTGFGAACAAVGGLVTAARLGLLGPHRHSAEAAEDFIPCAAILLSLYLIADAAGVALLSSIDPVRALPAPQYG